jgi:hypothetical protein
MASSRRLKLGVIAFIFGATLGPARALAPATCVRGYLFGHDFHCEEARINSYSLVLRQSDHVYVRVVFNFLATGKKLPGSDFSFHSIKSDFSNSISNNPRVQVFVRTLQDKRAIEKPACPYDMHVRFFARQKDRQAGTDTTSGVLQLKFSDGDYLNGSFCAKESPRVIWDDETPSN